MQESNFCSCIAFSCIFHAWLVWKNHFFVNGNKQELLKQKCKFDWGTYCMYKASFLNWFWNQSSILENNIFILQQAPWSILQWTNNRMRSIVLFEKCLETYQKWYTDTEFLSYGYQIASSVSLYKICSPFSFESRFVSKNQFSHENSININWNLNKATM